MNQTTETTTETTISHYLCIGCPLGCRLEVEADNGHIVEVRGFTCKRGEEYAKQEHTEPRRMVTTTVRVNNGIWAKLPVKTTAAIPNQSAVRIMKLLSPVRRRGLRAVEGGSGSQKSRVGKAGPVPKLTQVGEANSLRRSR